MKNTDFFIKKYYKNKEKQKKYKAKEKATKKKADTTIYILILIP
jgi:hypothetical protein